MTMARFWVSSTFKMVMRKRRRKNIYNMKGLAILYEEFKAQINYELTIILKYRDFK